MEYKFLDSAINKDSIILPESEKIHPILLKNNYSEILKTLDFVDSDEKFLHIHGFMGTGKRQFINYICQFLSEEVVTLEYYCKEATVCDDILLSFIDKIENLEFSAVNLNAKITALNVKFQQQISSIKKPFLIILHSYDDILPENEELVKELLKSISEENNIKLILSTRALNPQLLDGVEEDKKIFLKALKEDLFEEFLNSNQIVATNQTIQDFYKYTRGYYYYIALSIKIMQAMKIDLMEFLQKFNQSEMTFDSYLGMTYINLIPNTIRNFFWFLRTIRHGLTLNALAIFEIYDEFSIEYLKSNLMVFQSGETIYVQDYFLQKIDISIPEKTEIKLHKYIIGIYEGQLKESLKNRTIMISRQALRAEIEYHNKRIEELKNKDNAKIQLNEPASNKIVQPEKTNKNIEFSLEEEFKIASTLASEKKYTDAIEKFRKIIDFDKLDLTTLVEVRLNLARLYKEIAEYTSSNHYYSLVETYYSEHKEVINLNYLYYEITDLYHKMYKIERAIETAKKVIYSVDTPQSLLVSACTLLGNIYSDINNIDEAYSYYKKALDSLDENVEEITLAELYFKFALVNDDKGRDNEAFEYYNKCIAVGGNNTFKALAYSNLASCYYEKDNIDEARNCFEKAYEIEKNNNNYDGIYYNASHLAKIYAKQNSKKTLAYLTEAKKCAEFINEDFYILESNIAMGDYYYNNPEKLEDALREYLKAQKIADKISEEIDISKIENRIKDMKLRLDSSIVKELEEKYGKN